LRRLFPGRNPLGRQIAAGGLDGKQQYEMVGVVKNPKSRALAEASHACLFLFSIR